MAQAGDYDQSMEDLNDESGGGKTSLFGKLKSKTKDQKNKLRTKLHGSNKNDDSNPEDSIDDETTSPLGSGPEDSEFTDSGVTEPEKKESSDPSTGEHFPGNFTGIADDKTASEASADESLSKDFEGLSTNEKSESADKDTQPGAGEPNFDKDTTPSADSKDAEELETSKPMTESAADTVTSAKDQTTEKLFGAPGSEQKFTSPDAPATSEQAAEVGDKASEVGDKASEAGKTWSQWAAEKVGYAKDTAAAKAPTTEDGTPVHEKAYGTAVDKATQAKDAAAAQIPDQSSIPSDPAQQTYFQKATGGIYGAKDSLFSSTQPGEHDKALSQKVTESVGNLPASLKSSLGFGKPASSPTTTAGLGDESVKSTSDEAGEAPPQSPGLVGRITGLFGAKKPAEASSPSSESAISESGPETQTGVSE